MLTLAVWVAVLLLSGLPFASIAWLWKRKAKSKSDWALTLSVVSAISLLAFVATPWAMSSYYLRYILVALFAPALYFSFRRMKKAHLQGLLPVGNKRASALRVMGVSQQASLLFHRN